MPTVSVSTYTRSPGSSARSVASARHGFVLGPEQTVFVAMYSAPRPSMPEASTVNRSRSVTPGAIAASNSAERLRHDRAVRAEQRHFLRGLHLARFLRRGCRVDQRQPLRPAVQGTPACPAGRRRRGRRATPSSRKRRHRLAGERTRHRPGIVVELPAIHRPNVERALPRPMHRVRVLEQDRRSLDRHDGAASERAHAPDRHRCHAGRVARVRLAEQQARLEVVRAHRRCRRASRSLRNRSRSTSTAT